MFCIHCEARIKKSLSGLDGIKSVSVSYRQSKAVVTFDPMATSIDKMKKMIEDEGYEVVENTSTIHITAIIIVLLSLYLLAKYLGWTNILNIFPSIETTVSLGMVFIIGLLTSIHCIAMCGGINISQTVISVQRQTDPVKQNLLYNTGRIISYTVTGALCGGIGKTLGLSGRLRGIIPIIAGILMIYMALQMLGFFRFANNSHFVIPFHLHFQSGEKSKERSSFLIGLLNGLMPCGPLQSMQIYALSTGSILQGAVSMFLFCLGTVPLMFGFGFLFGRLNMKYRKYMLSVSAVLVFLMGINMVSNGLSLAGVLLPEPALKASDHSILQDDVQKVWTEIDYGSYPEFSVQKGIPVEWTIYVPEGKLTGCNGEILVPAYGIDIILHEGENLVQFLPENSGTVPYSCWMGMIRSSITVLD